MVVSNLSHFDYLLDTDSPQDSDTLKFKQIVLLYFKLNQSFLRQ